MPLLQTRGAASAQGFGWTAVLAQTAWIAKLATSANAQSVVFDASGNVYVVGGTATGSFSIGLAKYNSTGVIQWQRQLADSGFAWGYGIALDSSNNVYVCGQGGSSTSNYDVVLIKYNNSGTVQWQRKLAGASTSQGDLAQGIAIDSSDNVYITGTFRDNFNDRDIFTAKYDSSGTIQWQRKLTGSADVGLALALDSSANVYIAGFSNNAGSTEVQIAKYNSSGTIQFQKRITLASGWSSMSGQGIAVDSSSNIYIAGDINGSNTSNTDHMYFAKLDSTGGTITWDNRLYSSSGGDNGRAISVDASGNVYVTGNSFSGTSGQKVCQIAKYNSSGTLQWQRMIERPSGSASLGWGIQTDTKGNYYIAGDIDNGGGFLIAKLPVDGSKTGTYTLGTSISYSATSMTNGSVGRSTATSTLSAATATLTGSTPSLTATTPTFTATVVTL